MSGPLLIDKIVEDALKTADKTLKKNIYIYMTVFIGKNIRQQLK